MTHLPGHIPHLRVVVAVSTAAIFGFSAISFYVLWFTTDDVTKGAIVGTWQNVALLAFGFWLGSSSGGKSKDSEPPKVEIEQPANKPIPVATDIPRPTFGVDDPDGGKA